MHKQGIYRALAKVQAERGIEMGSKNFIVRTQNPCIESGIQKALDEFMREGCLKNVEVTRHFLPAVYGRMLTEEMPSPHYPDLNYHEGDAYRIVFKLIK